MLVRKRGGKYTQDFLSILTPKESAANSSCESGDNSVQYLMLLWSSLMVDYRPSIQTNEGDQEPRRAGQWHNYNCLSIQSWDYNGAGPRLLDVFIEGLCCFFS